MFQFLRLSTKYLAVLRLSVNPIETLKPTEAFQYTHFSSCHTQGVKKGSVIKGEAL